MQNAPIWTAADIPELDLVVDQNGGSAAVIKNSLHSWQF